MARPEWADWHPPPEHEEAARQAADDQERLCHTCERFVTALRIEDCPVCGDEA